MNYASDISPVDAYEILKNEPNSFLIDVRTLPEWQFSGVPNLELIGKKAQTISWVFYPKMDLNNDFAEQVTKIVPDKNTKLFFMCKIGGRSLDAAIKMANLGYKNCYNVIGGFEGDVNEEGQRGKINGWKGAGLPWYQN